MGPATRQVTDATFKKDVLESSTTVLVDFWADWCGPCKLVSPVLEEIAAAHPDDLLVATLDIDSNEKTVQEFEVMSVPTMMVFQNGEVVLRIVGAKPRAALLADLQPYLP